MDNVKKMDLMQLLAAVDRRCGQGYTAAHAELERRGYWAKGAHRKAPLKSNYRLRWNGQGFDRAEYIAEWFDTVKWSPCTGIARKTQFEAQADCLVFSIPTGPVKLEKIDVVMA